MPSANISDTVTVHYGYEQGTPEWLAIRAGIPTASEFKSIITPSGKKTTGQARLDYMGRLLAERAMGAPIADTYESGEMRRGKWLEPEAIAFYEETTGKEAQRVTFVDCELDIPLRGKIRFGCSPDVMTDNWTRGAEIKSHEIEKHMAYYLAWSGIGGKEIAQAHRPQVQGQMLVCGFKEWDLCAYHPTLPKIVLSVERDEEFCNNLRFFLHDFCFELEAAWERLKREYGYDRWPIKLDEVKEERDTLTDADVDMLVASYKESGIL